MSVVALRPTSQQSWRTWPAVAKVRLLARLRATPSPVAMAAERSMAAFIRLMWPVVEPGTPYIHGWHIDALCEHLEAVARGEIRNLIINIPPRHMKSLTVSVFWPTWVWTTQPAKRFLFASYAAQLALRDAVRSRRLIQSPTYQLLWGSRFTLTGDQNQKARYENDKGGFRISVGVGGAATGEGGDFVIVDDPMKAMDAHSRAAREAVKEWWDGTISTRLNDPRRGGKIIIMQRLHADDLTGHVLRQMREGGEQYETLILPAEYEPRVYVSSIGWRDPRTQPGELLWPERFGKEEIDALKRALGEQAAGQLQQRPAPSGGAIFRREWWRGRNRFNASDRRLRQRVVGRWLSFDTALKDREQNDFTGFAVHELLPDYRLLVRRVWWQRLQFPQLAKVIEDEAVLWMEDGKLRGILIEDKGSGTSALQTLRQSGPPWLAALLIPFIPSGSKEYRARQASLWCERGCVLLPNPSDEVPWLMPFEEDFLFQFPRAEHDDPVDAFVQGILYLEHYLAEGWRARQGVSR